VWTLYQATNLINGKRYIGVTGRGLDYRRKRHLYRALRGDKACPRLYDAIRKYGVNNFEWTTLAEEKSKKAAYDQENTLVAGLQPEYNSAPGGQVGPEVPWNRKPVICLNDGMVHESASQAARFYDLDHSEVSKACKGLGVHAKWQYFRYYERPLSMQECAALIEHDRDARTIKMRRGGSRKANVTKGRYPEREGRQVICLDDGKVFQSASAAARHYDTHKSSMIEMCLGKKRWPLVGRYFAYITEVGQRWAA
jgi:hypothetical protein